MGLISENCKAQIRSRVPLEELLREYNVTLVASGKRLKALCPFHAERTPSFFVDPERQTYHCFGCGEHGDVFRFVQKVHQVDFLQAVEMLARRAGVSVEELPEAARRLGGRSLVALYDALDLAERFYHSYLCERPEAAQAREYLLGRGIGRESWDRFRLGFSPPEWDSLMGFSRARGFAPEVLERAGLARARERGAGYYDYFRGRIMFPIHDPQGRVMGFGARTLGSDEPKYLNSPATRVFDKSQVLYGLDKARSGIQRMGLVCLVEGYTDAIMAHQAGLDFFVAVLGTALSKESALRLSRLAPSVIVIFDGDSAGQKASERTLDLLVSESLDVRVYTVREGKDPCDAIVSLGGEEFWRRVRSEAVGIFEFKWWRTVESPAAKEAGPSIRARAIDEFLRLLMKVPNVVARRLITREFSERVGVPEAEIEARMRQLLVKPGGRDLASGWQSGRSGSTKKVSRLGRLTDGSSPESGGRPSAGPTETEPRGGGAGIGLVRGRGEGEFAQGLGVSGLTATDTAARQNKLEELVIECCLARPERAKEIADAVPEGFFEDPALALVFRALGLLSSEGRFAAGSLMDELVDTQAGERVHAILGRIQREEERGVEGFYDEVIARLPRDIRRHVAQRRMEELRERIAREEGLAESSAESAERLRALRREYFEALKALKRGGGAGCEPLEGDGERAKSSGGGPVASREPAQNQSPVEGEGRGSSE